MLTYADVCWRMLTYADVCWRMLTYADVCWRMLTYDDVCWRMLTYADVCWRMLTYVDVRTPALGPCPNSAQGSKKLDSLVSQWHDMLMTGTHCSVKDVSCKAAFNRCCKRQNWFDELSIYSTNHIRTTTGYPRVLIQKHKLKRRKSRAILFRTCRERYQERIW